ncbi:hypothetical protein Xph01_57760 [Micromonospora phaseoli]|nr:hypothetical protein Xph01_57760 [Micromonospora phaseoli]
MVRVLAAWAGAVRASGAARTTTAARARRDGFMALLHMKGCGARRSGLVRRDCRTVSVPGEVVVGAPATQAGAGEDARMTRRVGTVMDSGLRPAMTSVSSRTV